MIKKKDKELLKKLGASLKKKREAAGLSLRDLSYRCAIDHSDIAKIERGEKNVTFLTMVQLAQALEINLNELIDFEL